MLYKSKNICNFVEPSNSTYYEYADTLSEFILSHVKFQHGDYLVIRTEDGNEYIRYQGTRIITYKEIRYIGRGTYIVKNNNSKYGLIRCEGLKVKILRGIKYSNIELASDGDSISLYGESGRPRYVSLHSISIDY